MKYDKVSELALRRGFFFPAAEIYNSIAGFYEWGPYGTALKHNFVDFWRKNIVQRDSMIELDGAQILPEAVFENSGHLQNFVDPLVECKKCKAIFRADKLLEKKLNKPVPEGLPNEEFDKLLKKHGLKCESCKSDFSKVRKFNMMFRFTTGPRGDDKVALRPETCQNIFLDFQRLYKVMRAKLPVGLAQVGKSFRNEISPRQGVIRQREFTQVEVEVFFNPKTKDFDKFNEIKKVKLKLQPEGKSKVQEVTAEEAVKKKIVSNKLTAYYLARLQQFYENIGLKNFRLRQLDKDEKAFYAKESWDFEAKTSVGWVELVACNNRGDHDLSGHSKGSRKDLKVLDGDEKVLPHVFELSIGVDRSIYCLLEQSYIEEKVAKGERVVLKIPKKVAPVKVAVFPLMKKDNLPERAEKIYSEIKKCIPSTILDSSGSIGKRYRRQDEVGTPFCVTVDHDTLEDDTVTVRDRDSMKQEQIKIDKLVNYLYEKIYS